MKGIVIAFALLMLNNSFACIGGKSFLPKNNLKIPVTQKNTGISEAKFVQIINEFQTLYAPIFKERASTLKINNAWKSDTVNARAHRRGRTRYVTMYGGMARHPEMTEMGFALVVCHEIGHHIGGAPTAFAGMSSEGQSDYFASTKCMRRWLSTKTNFTTLASPLLVKMCSDIYKNQNEIDYCIATAEGGMSLARIFAVLQGRDMPQYDTPDTEVARRTNYRHPAAQCRLDTYLQGALCDNDIELPFSMRDASIGACYQANGDVIGFRPACWYNSPKS